MRPADREDGALLRAWGALVCRRVCADRFFNADASREIDRLLAENEALRDRVRDLVLRIER